MRFGGKPYLMTQRSYPKYQGDMGRVTMFEAEDFQGNVAFAVASYLGDTNLPTTCSGVTASMGTSSIAILTFLKAEVNAADQAARIAFAPFGQPNQIDSAKVTASMMGGKPHSVAQAGDANRVLISNSASSLGMLDTVSKTIVAPVSGYSVMYAPRPIVGGAIVLDGSGIAGIGFLANDNSLTNIYRPANAQVMSVYLDRSDADRLVWAEGRDVAGAAHFSYWTAPLVKAPNAIQPRKITDFEDTSGSYGGYMAVNQGLIVNAARFDRVLITRISDGWSWAISTPPSEYATRALWVDDDYVWIGRGHAVQSGLPEQGLNLDGMFRFSRKNLGNPTIPPS